ncbi:MAG: zinc transporter ZupT [Myxococcales bacterium SG8_38]|nr:MAG: zinc transporter ZupT [Myxococcales bacterium SG8_38]
MDVLFAMGLTVLAGVSTGVGGVSAFIAKRTNTRFLSASLGFSAGVMIYVSFVELLPSGDALLRADYGDGPGSWVAAGSFLGGMLAIALIDFLVPSDENPHDAALVEDLTREAPSAPLRRVGLLTALAIGIHNFPEGLVTFVTTLHDPHVGIPVAVAIALHNIPEGLAVAIPIYFATGSRRKAVWYSFMSGISEPLGAALGYLIIYPYFSEGVLGIVHAAVAGVMVFISLDQLVPNAKRYEEGHDSVYGLIAGVAVMAVTLLLL